MIRHLSGDDVRLAWPVMRQLRAHHTEESYTDTVARMMAQEEPYRLSVWMEEERVMAVAGWRYGESLFAGRYAYVDDLVSDESVRGRGTAWRLLAGIADLARERGCAYFELDSGVQRFAAHRFYLRFGFDITSHHFVMKL
jgi:GNAT superfamily N-acetyltransferase